jgi:6-phosphogluconolactonase
MKQQSRLIVAFSLLMLLGGGAWFQAYAQEFVYLSNQTSQNISALAVLPFFDGLAVPVFGSPFSLELTDPLPLGIAADRTGNFLYVADFETGAVSGFKVNRLDGELTPVPGSPFPAGESEAFPIGLAADPRADFLYMADDGVGGNGSISAYAINRRTGALSPVTGSPFPGGENFSPTGGFPDFLTVDPKGRFLFVGNGDLYVSAFTINAATGALTIVQSLQLPSGGDPAGLVVDPSGKYLYVSFNEELSPFEGVVGTYTIDQNSGALTLVAGPFATGGSAGGLTVTPSGQFVYVATFTGPVGTVAGFSVDRSTGALTLLPQSPFDTGGSGSTNVATDSLGTLFVCDAESNDVSIFRIDARSGALALDRSVAIDGVFPDYLAVVPELIP